MNASIIESFHEISLTIKFCSTAPGNNLATKYDHKYLIANEINRSPKNKTIIAPPNFGTISPPSQIYFW